MAAYAAILLRKIGGILPPALVLAGLAALLFWGHHHNWKVPAFAPLWGDAAANTAADVLTGAQRVEVVPITPAGETITNDVQPQLYRVRWQSAESIRKVGIEVAPVEERMMAQYVTANGVLDYNQTLYAELSPRAAGTVWDVLKKEGDPVRRGEVLALVSSPDVARAKNDFVQALLWVEVRSKLLERMLAVNESIPAQQLHNTRASLREARILLFNYQQQLISFGLPVRMEDVRDLSEEQVTRYLRTLSVPEGVIGKSDPALVPNNLLPLIAPFNGEVVKRDMVIGEVVSSSQVQLTVADTRRLWIMLDVRLEDAGFLKIGQEVRFTPDGIAPKEAMGQLTWISPGVDKRTRTVQVRAEVENPDRQLRPDTFGVGHVLVRSTSRSIAIPTRCLQRDGQAYVVFVRVSDTEFEQRQVEPGIQGQEFTEIRSGVRPGEVVVTDGSHLLKSAILRTRLAGHE